MDFIESMDIEASFGTYIHIWKYWCKAIGNKARDKEQT